MQSPATDRPAKTRMMWGAGCAACGLLLPFPMLFKIVTRGKTEKNKSFSHFFEPEKLNVKKALTITGGWNIGEISC